MRLTQDELQALLTKPGYGVVEGDRMVRTVPGTSLRQGGEAALNLGHARAIPERLPGDMRELPFMEEVRRLAQYHGWLVQHAYSSRKSDEGWPDMVLLRECLILAELKTNVGQPTQEQTVWLYLLEYAGIETFLWRPRDWPAIVQRLTRPWPERV